VLAKLAKSQKPKAKRALQEVWIAEAKAAAELAFDAFVESDPQIREGLPEQGSGHPAGVLRLLGRALETPADDGSCGKTFFVDAKDAFNILQPRLGAAKAGRSCGHRNACLDGPECGGQPGCDRCLDRTQLLAGSVSYGNQPAKRLLLSCVGDLAAKSGASAVGSRQTPTVLRSQRYRASCRVSQFDMFEA
jgi:hypothetical protein